MLNMKYVTIYGSFGEEIYIFPSTTKHDEFVERMGFEKQFILGAGFINRFHFCYGESVSLGVKARETEDTRIAMFWFEYDKNKNVA